MNFYILTVIARRVAELPHSRLLTICVLNEMLLLNQIVALLHIKTQVYE